MRPQLFTALLLGAMATVGSAAVLAAQRQTPGTRGHEAVLHNGWKLTPAGAYEKVGDMLLGCALSPDGSTLALTNAGFGAHHLYLVDAQTGKIRQALPISRAWNGVVWSADGAALYVSGGGSPRISVFTKRSDGSFAPADPLQLPDLTADPPEQKGETVDKTRGQAYVSGLALSHDGKTLFAANFATDTIYALSLPGGAITAQRKLQTHAHPYCLRLAPDGQNLYVTQTALQCVAVLSADDLTVTRTFPAGSHPNDLLFAPDGRLFVSCGNSDSVLAVDPATGEVKERLAVTLSPKATPGATPNGLALSPDGKTLYVAAAGNNAVAVIDVSRPGESQVRGFIPTGWYPTAVCAAPDGKQLFIGSGKGMGTRPNPFSKSPSYSGKSRKPREYTYIGDMLFGMIATVSVPDETQLAAYTRQVVANTPYQDAIIDRPFHAPNPGSSPVPSRVGDSSPIKHILYIIKENRTYDQVLGDMKDRSGKPIGNGDPDLTLFGEQVTPNIHELAREYVLFDNIYCSGEVSGNGHPWSTGAYDTDMGERAWTLSYSDHANWPLVDLDLYPPSGRIWDECMRKGLAYVSYYFTWTTDNTRQNMPEAWANGFWDRRDTQNADIFIADLHRYERDNNLPNLMVMSLREDHTHGTSPDAFTPQACVASNDVGVGRIVEALSHSKFWASTAVFIIEDDGQDGPDHVDAHRTEALVISPYTRRGSVDSTFYQTTSMLRTMELILGLPPMTEYDAGATPMYNAFASKPDLTPYKALAARIDLNVKNTQTAYGAKASQQMDFSVPDHLTAQQVDSLNRILWHSIKGIDCPYPAPVRRALIAHSGQPLKSATTADNDGDGF